MATAVLPNKCLLCTNQCDITVKLPKCGHVFCDACLKTCTCAKVMNETAEGLKCPTCDVYNDKPKNVDMESWINTLTTDSLTVKADDKPSSSQDVECASCKSLGRSEKAVKYCINCMECMCQQCLNICHTPKPMRHHEFTDIENTNNKSDDFNLLQKMSTLVACPSHPNETIKFHCFDDDAFCCTICIVADHRKCSKVVELDKHVEERQYKYEMAEIKDTASKVSKSAAEIMEQLQCRVEDKIKQRITITKHMKEIRVKINKVLDKLELECGETANALTLKETSNVQNQMDKLRLEVETLETHASLMAKTDEHGVASHQYIARLRYKENLKKFEFFLEDMASNFRSINVSFHQTKLLDELLNVDQNDTDKLGSIVENPDKPLKSVYNTNTKLEQCSFTKTGKKKVAENYAGESPWYYSASLLTNNRLVFLDLSYNSGHCLLATEDGTVVSSCDFISCGASPKQKPYCITVTKPDGMMAVSLPAQKKICFVTTTDGQLKVKNKILQTKYKPGAICGLKNGNIAIAWREPVAFGIININAASADNVDKVYFCQDKAGRSLKSFDYMAVDEERSHVIQPCTKDKAVYCFDFNGYPKFKYTNPELNDPQGVAVDRDGNIYVCDCEYPAHCIHVISPTGSASRLIKDGCPPYPLAIAFNQDGDSFAVTSTCILTGSDPTITLFHVQSQ